MFSRINIIKIIADHFHTLRKLGDDSGRIYVWDFVMFILIPLIVAAVSVYLKADLEQHLNNLIAAISIFGGFLFNLLAIIYGQIDKIKNDANEEGNDLKKKFVKEIHINISFNIVLSILLVSTLIVYSSKFKIGCYTELLDLTLLGINCFLLTLFGLTLLMVLNRVYVLLKKESEA